MIDMSPHYPVLLREVVECINPVDGGKYIDCTFGAGSYSRAILEKANCSVYAIDQDKNVSDYVDKTKKAYPDRFFFTYANFADIGQIADQQLLSNVDGIVFDIGVSSMQLFQDNRGFSFMRDGPLDMRMNQESNLTAFDVVNYKKEKELADIIYAYGDERYSRKIASAIIKQREKKLINSTLELANLIADLFGGRGKIHPATKTFQAIRIYVNNELLVLRKALLEAASLLKNDGRMAVVSFHSLECRIVKGTFRELIDGLWGGEFVLLSKKAIVPSEEEVAINHNSRSAKLRVIKKLGGVCKTR